MRRFALALRSVIAVIASVGVANAAAHGTMSAGPEGTGKGAVMSGSLSSQPTSLEELIAIHAAKDDAEPQLKLLQAAQALARGDAKPEELRADARRNLDLPPAVLLELRDAAHQVGNKSLGEMHAMLELIQAAAVGTCPIHTRNMLSGQWALASKRAGRFERARRAYADYLEGIRIVAAFSQGSEQQLDAIENAILQGWNDVRERTDANLEILSPMSEDASSDWFNLMLWNSDLDAPSYILAQVDATFRFAVHLDHWVRTSAIPLGPVIERMLVRCEDLGADGNPTLMKRCMLTIGNALMEIEQWGLAAQAHAALREIAQRENDYPIRVESPIQLAHCRLMQDDVSGCRELLDSVDKGALEAGAEVIVVGAAQLVRYLALELHCFRRMGQEVPQESMAAIKRHLETVSAMFTPNAVDRQASLRSLYFLALARNVGKLVSSETGERRQ